MSTEILAGHPVEVTAEGYLTNADQWTPEVAEQIAANEGITLTEEHYKVIDYLRDAHKNGVNLTIRGVGKSGVVTIKDLYRLFPGAPLKKASKISGIPKPVSCI
jgi:tRNA 2-thiouridine synthesizing protein E